MSKHYIERLLIHQQKQLPLDNQKYLKEKYTAKSSQANAYLTTAELANSFCHSQNCGELQCETSAEDNYV